MRNAPTSKSSRNPYQPDARFSRIGREVEKAAREDNQVEINDYSPRFFGNLFASTKANVAFQIRKTVDRENALLETMKQLEIIQAIKPDMEAALKTYETSFMEWEKLNRKEGYGPSVLLQSEKDAKLKIAELEERASQELAELKSDIIIPGFRNLLVSRMGWVSVENALRFWRELEDFLKQRVADLEEESPV